MPKCDPIDQTCIQNDTAPPITGQQGVWLSTVLQNDVLTVAAYDHGLGALHGWTLDEIGFKPTHRISANGTAIDRGQYVALASAPNNQIYAAYYDAVDTDIRRARWVDGNWEELQGTVDGGQDDVGKWLSLAVDSTGAWHLAYRNDSKRTLRIISISDENSGCYGSAGVGSPLEVTHEVMTDAGWPSSDFGTHTSIGTLDDGRVVVSFYDSWRRNLMLATCSGPEVQLQLLDGEGAGNSADVGRWNSLAVDPVSGRLGIAYHDATNGTLKYVSSRDGTLAPIVIDDGQDGTNYVGLATSLVFYSDTRLTEGLPRIAYVDATGRQIKLARQSVYGLWSSTTVTKLSREPKEIYGFGPAVSLAINTAETEYVTYTRWNAISVSMHVSICNDIDCSEATE
jgi:hypothetical protein